MGLAADYGTAAGCDYTADYVLAGCYEVGLTPPPKIPQLSLKVLIYNYIKQGQELHCSRNLPAIIHRENLLGELMAIKFNKSISFDIE